MKYLWLLFISGALFAQTGVFTTGDTARLSDATLLEGAWLDLGGYRAEGIATLFVSGDSVSGFFSDNLTVKYQLKFGTTTEGEDALVSEVFTLGTVDTTLLKETIGDGSLIGETFDMADDTDWKNANQIQFSFLGAGTQETNLISIFDIK